MNQYVLVGVTLGPPLLMAGAAAIVRPHSSLGWLLSALLVGGVAVYVYRASPIWELIGVGWRLLPLLAALAAILWSARHLPTLPGLPSACNLLLADTALRCTLVALFAGMLVNLQIAGVTPTGAIDLSFPLTGGRFVILAGGSAVALNGHRVVRAQAYATDIVALNDRGRRAQAFQPQALDGYEIFDRAVLAPCDGVVLGGSDGAPDAPIGAVDPQSPAGNHVLLYCVLGGAEVTLLLAHLRSGSIAVTHGEWVQRGALVGRVGNSGNSTEPHLHIHAVRGRVDDVRTVAATAEAVPLTFNGRFLIRNAVVHVTDLP